MITPIILLHGAVGAADQLETLKEALATHDQPVYSFSSVSYTHLTLPTICSV